MTAIEIEDQITTAPAAIPSLRSNFAWTFAGNMLYAACQWGMLTALAKLGSPSIVGQFALGLAISAPVFMLCNLQLRSVQATDVRGEYRFADYFTLRILTTVVGMLSVAVLALALRLDQGTRAVILLIAVSKSIECISDVIGGSLQLHERLDQVAVSLMIRGVLSVIAFSATFLWTHCLSSAIIAMCLAWLAVLICYDLPRAKATLCPNEPKIEMNWRLMQKLVLLSLPLGLVMTMISLNTNMPRYYLQRYSGASDLGIFSSLAYVMVAANLVVLALCQSATTRLSVSFAEGKYQEFSRLLFRLSGVGIGIVVAGVPLALLLGRPLLTLLYGSQYGDHVSTLAILVAATGVGAISFFITTGLSSARHFRVQGLIYGFSTMVTAASGFVLIPRWRIDGAAGALLLSAIVCLAASLVALSSLLRSSKLSTSG